MRRIFCAPVFALAVMPLCFAQTSPSFDCSKANTPSELLICRDPGLAAEERTMASAYREALRNIPANQNAQFRRDHYDWSLQYRKACNAPMLDDVRKACISEHLQKRTKFLKSDSFVLGGNTGGGRADGPSLLLNQLKQLGTKSSVLAEIRAQAAKSEFVIGYAKLDFDRKIVFTNRRIVSISPLPLVGMSTEWGNDGGIVLQGGNFQLRNDQFASLNFTPSRIRKAHGKVLYFDDLTEPIKKYGPKIVKDIWPYELDLVDAQSKVVNRFYSVKGPQAQEIAALAVKARLRVLMVRDSQQ